MFSDHDGRYLTAEITLYDQRITIGNFYGPEIDNPTCIRDFCTKIDDYNNEILVIDGDFNFCLIVTLIGKAQPKETETMQDPRTYLLL